MYIIFYLLFILSAVLVLLPWKLLASVCLGRPWNQRQGLVRDWVAAPAVAYSPILDRQALLQLLQLKSRLGSMGTDAALRRLRSLLSSHFSSLLSPLLTRLSAVTASRQWLWSAAVTSQSAGLISPAFRSCLQTSLKRRLGFPASLVPVASSL